MKSYNKAAIAVLVIMFLCSWLGSMTGILRLQVWDRKYALHKIRARPQNEAISDLDSSSSAEDLYQKYNFPVLLEETYESYLTIRYVSFISHVFGAFIWWNLYFIQLIPSIRRKYKKLHRWMGRLLLFTALCQVVSGVGLACGSNSSVIKLVSLALAAATIVCLYYTVIYAVRRDIQRHQYWSLRLVGYMQTIAAQRFWFGILFSSHYAGLTFLYPRLGEEGQHNEKEDLQSSSSGNTVILRMFDDSFILAMLSAVLITEWYLSVYIGMTHTNTRIEDHHSAQIKKE